MLPRLPIAQSIRRNLIRFSIKDVTASLPYRIALTFCYLVYLFIGAWYVNY